MSKLPLNRMLILSSALTFTLMACGTATTPQAAAEPPASAVAAPTQDVTIDATQAEAEAAGDAYWNTLSPAEQAQMLGEAEYTEPETSDAGSLEALVVKNTPNRFVSALNNFIKKDFRPWQQFWWNVKGIRPWVAQSLKKQKVTTATFDHILNNAKYDKFVKNGKVFVYTSVVSGISWIIFFRKSDGLIYSLHKKK